MPDETKLQTLLEKFNKKLPHFSDGRIDYSKSDEALVLNCFVRYNDKILLLKRSQKVSHYKGKWNAISGYIDEVKPLKLKILEELKEEVDIAPHDIDNIEIGHSITFHDPNIDKIWIIFPALVDIKKNKKLSLDWEHTEYRWIKFNDLKNFDFVPGLAETLKSLIKQ